MSLNKGPPHPCARTRIEIDASAVREKLLEHQVSKEQSWGKHTLCECEAFAAKVGTFFEDHLFDLIQIFVEAGPFLIYEFIIPFRWIDMGEKRSVRRMQITVKFAMSMGN